MAQKRQTRQQAFRKIDVETIQYMSDSKVEMLLDRYKQKRRYSSPEFYKSYEEEICYLFREAECRKNRKIAHQNYLRKKTKYRAK